MTSLFALFLSGKYHAIVKIKNKLNYRLLRYIRRYKKEPKLVSKLLNRFQSGLEEFGRLEYELRPLKKGRWTTEIRNSHELMKNKHQVLSNICEIMKLQDLLR